MSECKKRADFSSGRGTPRAARQTPAHDGRTQREGIRRERVWRQQTNMGRRTAGSEQHGVNGAPYPDGRKRSRHFICLSTRTVLVFSRCSCRWITASATHLIVVACPARGRGRPWSFCFWFSSLDSGFGPASGLGRLRGGAAGGRGLAAPSPPHPLPRLWAAIACGERDPSGAPCLPLLTRAIGRRPSAVPHAGRTSGRRRSFRPSGRRSPPRHDALTLSGRMKGSARSRGKVRCCRSGRRLFL